MRGGPHPHARSLGGALRALPSGASLKPQALLIQRHLSKPHQCSPAHRTQAENYSACAPDTTSMISRVIAA
jgi:hypothetical protein